MTAADSPDVLADPVGAAVALITLADPGLSREAAERAVTSVAAGRSVRRRLAGRSLTGPGSLPTAGRPRRKWPATCCSRCARPEPR